MHIQVDIEFKQLVEIVKKLPKRQRAALKKELEKEEINSAEEKPFDMHEFLMNGPVFTEEQIAEIEEARKLINESKKTGF